MVKIKRRLTVNAKVRKKPTVPHMEGGERMSAYKKKKRGGRGEVENPQ